ncbi:MAG: hypothetical protein V5A46_09285 [Haloferacaceae archaeon]
MSLLDTVRSWIRSLFGAEPAESDEEEQDAEEPAAGAAESGPEPQLDPEGVTEVRVESDDDPIDRLQEVKQKREEQASDGDDTEADPDTESDSDTEAGPGPGS